MNMQMLLQMLQKGANPQQIVMSLMEGQMQNSPMGKNLLALAQKGQTKQLEQIARNIVAQKGGDFDKEFMAFKNTLGLK